MKQNESGSFSNEAAGASMEPSPTLEEQCPLLFDELVDTIEVTTLKARAAAARQVNIDQLLLYWDIGRMIVEYEQSGKDRADYGEKTLISLSKRLTTRLGRGFSRTNLYNMRLLFLTHKKIQTLSGELSWSHYCELLNVKNDKKRLFYEHEAANAGWSVRELRRQMDSLLYDRVLAGKVELRDSDADALAQEGIAYKTAADAIKDPFVLEFLDLPDGRAHRESELQDAILAQIEKFMLELGRGFMFVGSGQRVPVGSSTDFVDLVFYCKPLRAYVLIELKTQGRLSAAVGQINEYLNYYAAEVNDEHDNPPIGIILSADRNDVRAKYALGGLSNAVFASTYTLQLPDAELLEEQVKRVIEACE